MTPEQRAVLVPILGEAISRHIVKDGKQGGVVWNDDIEAVLADFESAGYSIVPAAGTPAIDALLACKDFWSAAAAAVTGPIDQANDLLRPFLAELARTSERAGAEGMRESAIVACQQQLATFLSQEYAGTSSRSSFVERFACQRCAEEIAKIPLPGDPT